MTIAVTMVRVYLTESDRLLNQVMSKLHDEQKVRGVTVFRGVSGFGKSGAMHSAGLLDLSSDLPLIVEFFDEPAKASEIIEHLNSLVGPGHVVSWRADLNNLG
jgi:PII-like signaling protein